MVVHGYPWLTIKNHAVHGQSWFPFRLGPPPPAFLAKYQLASDGPDFLTPVVIPALKPFLSSDLTDDMTLCPVRALRYYLDRSSALRKGKNLLFISFEGGFDIMRSTISPWIRATVLLAY